MAEQKPIDALAQILNDADACVYINPFSDSKNALEFGKYAYKIRDLQREVERLKEIIDRADSILVCAGFPKADLMDIILTAKTWLSEGLE